ncbi:MAG: hypothetical protein HC915_13580 [Anaerolineae bacterium]|nr:hypothetical protein [Anaerolineae bacterium]
MTSLRRLRKHVEGLGPAPDASQQRRQVIKPVRDIMRSSSQQIAVPVVETVADTKPRRPEGLDEAVQQSQAAPSAPAPSTPPRGVPRVDPSRLRYADEVTPAETPAAPPAPTQPCQPPLWMLRSLRNLCVTNRRR